MPAHTPGQAPGEHLLAVDEACTRLALGRTSLYEEIAKGELQVVKYGRRTFIPVSQIDDWIRRHLVTS